MSGTEVSSAVIQLRPVERVQGVVPVEVDRASQDLHADHRVAQDFRGAQNYRPNLVGDPLAPEGERTVTNYFNRNAVVIPTDPSQPFGNAKRNTVRSDPFFQLDMALSKIFDLGWRDAKLEFRTEVFNVLNKTNFRAANGNRSAAGFGTITATYDPRQIQFGLKVTY